MHPEFLMAFVSVLRYFRVVLCSLCVKQKQNSERPACPAVPEARRSAL